MASRRGRHQDDARPAPELIERGRVARVKRSATRARLEQSQVSLRYGTATAREHWRLHRRCAVVRQWWRRWLCLHGRGGRRQWLDGRCTRPVPGGLRAAVRLLVGEVRGTRYPGSARLVREAGLPRLLHRAFATSRAIWAWLVPSCAMLAFSSSTCLVIAARSCAIACNCSYSVEGTVAAVAAACSVLAGVAGCSAGAA